MPDNHKLYNNASLNIVPRSKFNFMSESWLIQMYCFSFFSHSCLVFCSFSRRKQRLQIFIVRNYPRKFNNLSWKISSSSLPDKLEEESDDGDIWKRWSSLSRLSKITRSSKRRCEYDVTRQLMRFSARTCHRRLSYAKSVMAAGFLRFLASYY